MPATATTAKESTTAPSSAQSVEDVIRKTADRVAREVAAQFGDRIQRLEKEVKRGRKAAAKAAELAASAVAALPPGKKGK